MNPYQQRSSASRRTPPPDGVRHAPTQRTPPSDMVTANIPASRSTGEVPAPSQFLIVGLFALRLTKRLIQGLEPYTDRDTDIDWLDNFLGYFALDFALARISGVMRTDYLQTYPLIISRMKKQPRYPIHFMRLNPDKSARNAGQPRAGDSESTEWTDSKFSHS